MSEFTLIAEFKAKRGESDRLVRELTAMVEPSLAEDGCLAYRPFVDAADPSQMIIIEQWTDQAALDRHFETPHFTRVAGVLDEVLERPFTLTRLIAEQEAAAESSR
ncbi:putative quinol monooxygenase [Phytoactinopolyspora halotolerans]|uniref:Antibiotic biosynthesis monooxygenase n=1 Tax=Phytoactinopolyspora halotolerans TaxID=1981512 RepID=A0A6L9SIY7_9ACTN|nr:putative quinol monooxygenase [Phytoactinopolyspora halotolerans]NEE04648.1 antibiotic biosynthesis monooxygenase [Phytoactinopolyspora halotolerans]